MNIHWVFESVNNERTQIKQYWQKKLPRLERLLSRYHFDLRELRMTLHRRQRPEQWELRAVLHLPTGTLVAREIGTSWTEAIDRVADQLAREISRHKCQVRKEYLYRRRRQRQQRFESVRHLLEQDVAAERRAAFFQLLEPMLDSVYDYARRELAIREAEGTIKKNLVSPRDLVDDVMTLAWQEFNDRPAKLELDLWLFGLVRKRLDQLSETQKLESLEQQVPTPDDAMLTPDEDVDETEYWLERAVQQANSLELADLIPDPETEEAWSALSEEEQQERLHQAVAALPAKQRETFFLSAIGGYEPAEIAKLQERSESEVKQDLEQARDVLKQQLAELSV